MLNKIVLITAVTLSILFSMKGQDRNVHEQVYLHLNTPFLLTGETLYFSAFVTSAATGKPSPLSSILYVELIGKNGYPVFQRKISLEGGRGQGEFFVSSLISTGSYQLVAYTRWMKNFHDYFQMPVTIVNPFEEYQQPEQSGNARMAVAFFPEGGALVPGKSNEMVFRASNRAGEGISASGKVVTATGEKIADIETGQNGIGRFTLVPETGQSYQVIMEDELGDFHFFDLPKPDEDAKVIQVRNKTGAYKLNVISGAAASEEVLLEVSDGQNTILKQHVYTDAPILLSKKKVTSGVLKAFIREGSKEESVRLFYHKGHLETKRENLYQTYGTRSIVQVPVEFDHGASVSVSVRKIDTREEAKGAIENTLFCNVNNVPFTEIKRVQTDWLEIDNLLAMASWKSGHEMGKESITLLPELRGEFISGKIASGSGTSVQDKFVSYSISGEKYQVQAAKTDEEGSFMIRIDPAQGEREAYISVLGEEELFTFSLDNPFLNEYPDFDYSPLYLDSASVAMLVERSVRNQIENAYYELKKDSVVTKKYWRPQFGDFDLFYILDDYNRFPELYESFIEYIPLVAARKNKNRSSIKVFLKYAVPKRKEPLLLLDGVPTSAKRILDFSPYKIESIGIINNRFFLGPLVADGIISFHTFENDMHGFSVGENTLKVSYQGLEPIKVYTFPEYHSGDETRTRIPDYRDQLYWNPNVTISSEKPYLLEFYTSDTTGEFEVAIEGYSEIGEPVSIKKIFSVKGLNQPASN